MARPARRKSSRNAQFRKRIPSDVRHALAGEVISVLVGDQVKSISIGPTTDTIQFSLGTSDANEIKVRQSAALASLDDIWQSFRDGPVPLTHKQIIALAGEAYVATVGENEDEPGEAVQWEALQLLDDLPDLPPAPSTMALLSRHGIVTDSQSISRLERAIHQTQDQAFERLKGNAEGDYSADPLPEKFPKYEQKKQAGPQTGQKGVTFEALIDGWWAEKKAAGLSVRTYEGYKSAVLRLGRFVGHSDATKVAPQDVVDLKDARIAAGLSVVTIKYGDLAGIKNVFKWGVDNLKLDTNPADRVTVAKSTRTINTFRKGFTAEEAIAILRHSNDHKRGRERKNTFAAKRWVPWLCAYTGARVGEMAQLRKKDVYQEGGRWVVEITPEAGAVKTHNSRKVPLHSHLVDMGFPDFATRSSDGHLFLTPSAGGDALGPRRGLVNRVREFVREVATAKDVQPNHGWRHLFKTIGRELEIADSILDGVCGHRPANVGADYGIYSVKAMSQAIEKYPRFEVEESK